MHAGCHTHFILRWAGIVCFVAYCTWNIYWLAQSCIPPSIFLAATGLPSPTTGGTRAIISLCNGHIVDSLRYNAMAVPVLVVFLGSVSWLTCQVLRQRRVCLPSSIFWVWMMVLGVAWVLKLTGDP